MKSLSTDGERLPKQERTKIAVAEPEFDWSPGGVSYFLEARGATHFFDMTLQETIGMSEDQNFVRVAGLGPEVPLREPKIRKGVHCQKK